ncbi:MAG: phosphate ABC transporter substrate-binding protein PstS [Planctomycetes bacterium GWF2_42_9]|nr:MAG: phosphate ABC transporter substrate-binding protein PstS [Planctomycetes bacterium GWF2_42_9]
MLKIKHIVYYTVIQASILLNGSPLGALTIDGEGASFPASVYRLWGYRYSQITGTEINYRSSSSGAGTARIKEGTIDFGGTDIPLSQAELDNEGLIQFPMLIGGIIIAANLPDMQNMEMRLTPELLADIFLGKIKQWDDPALMKINPGLKLPSMPIIIVYRSDNSGTTWAFTEYLSRTSPEWAASYGHNKAMQWKKGVGGKNNAGVANNIRKISGSIGYLEYSCAEGAGLKSISLLNKSGNYAVPGIVSFAEAGKNAGFGNDRKMELINRPGEKSWPVTTVSYILIKKEQFAPDKTREMLKFFLWCYLNGADIARELYFVPLPENIIKSVKALWHEKLISNGKQFFEKKD